MRKRGTRQPAPDARRVSGLQRAGAANGATLALLFGLVAITVIAYAPAVHFDFVSLDDPVYVTANPLLRSGLSWTTLAQVFGSTFANFWHPLTVLSLMLDVRLFGIQPGPMHVTSLLLHVVAAVLLFATLYRASGARAQSAFVAALFAVHPLHVESVAWISQRKDVLSTVFWMLTLAAYVWYVRVPRWQRYALALVFFALGLMAKPMLVTLPFTLLLFDVWPLGRVGLSRDPDRPGRWPVLSRAWLPLLVEKMPFFALSMAASIAAFAAQRRGGAVASLEGFSVAARLANAPLASVAYVAKMVWPHVLTVFYPYPLTPRVWPAAGAALVLLGVSVLVVRLAARRPYLAVGWLWYAVTLLPVSGLVQVGSHAMADRYTYVPLVGLFIIVSWGAGEVVGQGRARRAALVATACVAVAALVVVTRAQVMTWRNSDALWQHALHVMPDNYFAHNALGLEQTKQGRNDEALAHFTRSSELAPGFPDAENNIGLLLAANGKTGEAITHYREALRRAPDYAQARVNLGSALVQTGRAAEAVAQYEQALAVAWDEADTRAKLGAALMDTGRHDEAIQQFEASVRLDPASVRTRYNFANALERIGRSEAAVVQYREAARLGPASANIHDNMGIALEHIGQAADAAEEFTAALRLEPGRESTRANLGNALLALGRTEDAAEQFRAVLRANPNRADAHVGLGTALFDMGRLDQAMAEHRLAVQLAPNLADAHYNLAVTLQHAGRLAEAAAEYEETLRLEGGSADLHLALGVLLEQLGRLRESSSHYAAALRMRPGLTQASDGVARVAKAAGER